MKVNSSSQTFVDLHAPSFICRIRGVGKEVLSVIFVVLLHHGLSTKYKLQLHLSNQRSWEGDQLYPCSVPPPFPSILPSDPYPPVVRTPLLPSLYLSPAVFSSGFSNPCRYVPRIISRTGLGHPRMMSLYHCGCSWSIEDGHLFVSG